MTLDAQQGEHIYASLETESLAIVQLHTLLIDSYEGKEQALSSELIQFSCVRNPDVEAFLHRNALLFEKTHKSRTYLAVNEGTLISNSTGLEIYGYFTLSLKHLYLSKDISKRKQKELHGLFLPQGNVVVGYLLGQLGKNDSYHGIPIGDQLLVAAMGIIRNSAQRAVGGRFIIIECIQNEKLLDFYQRNGFVVLQIDPADGMAQLVRQID